MLCVIVSLIERTSGRNIYRSFCFLFFSLLFLSAGSAYSQIANGSSAPRVKETISSVTSSTVEVALPSISFDTNSSSLTPHLPEGCSLVGNRILYRLPLRLSKNGRAAIVSTIPGISSIAGNLPITLNRSTSVTSVLADRPVGYIETKYAGRMRGVDLSQITVVIGVIDVAMRQMSGIRSMSIRLTDSKGEPGVRRTDIAEVFRANGATARSRIHTIADLGKESKPFADTAATFIPPGIRSDDGAVYRLYVNKTGIYKITYDDLKSFRIDPSIIDTKTLRLIAGGQQIPIYIFDHQDGKIDPNDYIEFYGEEKLLKYQSKYGDLYYDPYTHENVYYVVWGTKYSAMPEGGPKHMVEESGEIREANAANFINLRDSSFSSTIHYEEDNYFNKLDIADQLDLSSERDHWFLSPVSRAGSFHYRAVAPFPDKRSNRPLMLRAALHGLTHFDPGYVGTHGELLPAIDSEDRVQINVNNHFLLQGNWDSQVLKFLSTDTVSQRYQKDSPLTSILTSFGTTNDGFENDFEVENRIDTAVDAQFAINWFDLTYSRLYIAYQNALKFSVPKGSAGGLYQFRLAGFTRTDVSVYRLGVSKISNVFITSTANDSNSGSVIFQLNVASDQDQFLAITDTSKLKPIRYVRDDDYVNLHDPSLNASYVLITSRDHLDKYHERSGEPAMKQLAEDRDKKGLKSILIDVANVFDDFSNGAKSPEAVKAFLRYAYFNWANPPKYVFLAGSARNLAEKEQSSSNNDQIPAPYIQAYLDGMSASDTWYSLLDGDDLLPDIVLGRLPSKTLDEDANYVEKELVYEVPLADTRWRNSSFFIAGNRYVGGNTDFPGQISTLLSEAVPTDKITYRQGADTGAYSGTSSQLVSRINSGVSYVHFMGHGGSGIWADVTAMGSLPLLSTTDIKFLTNLNKYPFVTSLTCFTGAYDGTYIYALLPSLLIAKNAGIIGGFGTSSYGFRNNDFDLARALLPHVYDSTEPAWGDRITRGKIDYYLTYESGEDPIPKDLMYCYSYLGDPSITPAIRKSTVTVSLSTRSAGLGAKVNITGTTNLQDGFVRIELVDDRNSPFIPAHVKDSIKVTNGSFSFEDVIPSQLPSGAGAYKVMVWHPQNDAYATTYADITFTNNRVSELRLDPYPIAPGTDVKISAVAQLLTPVQSANAEIRIYRKDAQGVESVTTLTVPMSLSGDRYTGTLSGAQLQAGDRLEVYVEASNSNGNVYSSVPVVTTIGAAADPAAYRDARHTAMVGKYEVTASGLIWRTSVFNWGSLPVTDVQASLLELAGASMNVLGQVTIPSIAAKGNVQQDFPVQGAQFDTTKIFLAVGPPSGSSPLNLRDSSSINDTSAVLTIAKNAFAYTQKAGSTINANSHEAIAFDHRQLVADIAPGALGITDHAVLRAERLYTVSSAVQPDVHFLPSYSYSGAKLVGYRVVSDTAGSIALQASSTISIALNLQDTDVRNHANGVLYIYRQDDRTRLWSILETTRNGDTLTAITTKLGNFAIAYHTDSKVPTVDMTVEGQVFLDKGEVPDHPHISAVLQDANGIDITPGKTIVKVDGRVLQPNEYALLDSARTATTANLYLVPSLNDGDHTITVQATDNDGLQSTEQALHVHVSHDFVINTLGSYPDPFATQMFIAYEIKGIPFAEDVELRIYTVSGKLARVLRFPSNEPDRTFGFLKGGTGTPTSLGYHEIWWDGRDDGGVDVANGVYFYKLIVKTKDDSRALIGKFARVR